MTETAEQIYTSEQIDDYCKHADDGEAVEIIRQLQAEIKNPSFGTTGN